MNPIVLIVALGLAGYGDAAPAASLQDEARQPAAEAEGGAPRWFKGNLHTHSLWSDGNDFPEMIVDWYRKHDYQFVALSDHNILSQGSKWVNIAQVNTRAKAKAYERYVRRFGRDWVETRNNAGARQVRLKPLGEFRTLFEQTGEFLLIQGEELSDHFEAKPVHMNATNLVELIRPKGGKSIVEVISNNLEAVEDQAKRLGQPILVHLNHPNFHYAITAEELAMVTKERFFEVYNGHPTVYNQGDSTHVGTERMWDIINTLRIGEMKAAPVSGLGTDDSHNYFKENESKATPGRGWIQVRARRLTPESILKGMAAGDFYASSGVALRDVRHDAAEGTLTVEVEPEGAASYTIEFVGTLEGYDATRKPVVDAQGKPLAVTQRYSDDIGRVLATVEGTRAVYKLTGKELYVRAVITSSLAPERPTFEGQKARAWTQPVGWEKRVAPPAAEGPKAAAEGGESKK